MAFIPLPLGVKVEVKFLKNGQLVVNIYHFTSLNPVGTLDLTGLAGIIKAAFNDNLKTSTTNNMTLDEIVLTTLDAEVGTQVVYTTGLPLAGTGGVEDLPSNVAVVISNRSYLTGRSQRGRTYMAGVVPSLITGNTVGATYQAALIAYHLDIAENALSADFTMGVASYIANGAPRTEAQFTPYQFFSVENITDSQRRRLPGRGV